MILHGKILNPFWWSCIHPGLWERCPERTDLRVAYDDQYLYLGEQLYDRDLDQR